MSDPLVWLILLLGAPVGSFMAAMADRLCEGRSVLAPSRCETCATRLRPWDMVPLVSAVLLRGRCRACGAAFPRRLLLAEILGFVAAMVAVAGSATTGALLALAMFLWLLVGLALADLRCFRLPDVLTGPLFVVGVWLALTDPGRTLPEALGAAGLAAGLLYLLRQGYAWVRGREGLGLGDVKLAAGLGAGLGATALPWLGLIGAAAALLVAASGSFGPLRRTTALPFGLFLCLAAGLLLGARAMLP